MDDPVGQPVGLLEVLEADTVYNDVFGIHTILDGVAALIARRSG